MRTITKLRDYKNSIIPDEKLTLRTFFEVFIGYFYDMMKAMMGPKRAKDILEKRGLKAVMVGSDGVVTLTKGVTKQQTPWGEGYTVNEFTADRREVLAPLSKAPVGKAPLGKVPVSKAPAVKRAEETK